MWTLADGREILFNRFYAPIAERAGSWATSFSIVKPEAAVVKEVLLAPLRHRGKQRKSRQAQRAMIRAQRGWHERRRRSGSLHHCNAAYWPIALSVWRDSQLEYRFWPDRSHGIAPSCARCPFGGPMGFNAEPLGKASTAYLSAKGGEQ
jgi:hypothetical protein